MLKETIPPNTNYDDWIRDYWDKHRDNVGMKLADLFQLRMPVCEWCHTILREDDYMPYDRTFHCTCCRSTLTELRAKWLPDPR
jgi:hypothetical protein